VYAFGATGISQLDSTYAQNTKDIEEYVDITMSGNISVKKGYKLSPKERIAKEVMERLMCNYRINWHEITDTLAITTDNLKDALHYDESQLKEMEADGIIELTSGGIAMTTEGHPFVRNVAAALDPLMQNTDKKFSKPI
jgi:oxygen-independent coproporphyrinogen-3 oxidase